MMYLTKMPLNRRRRGAGKILSSPQAMHAAVEASFPPRALAEAGGRALWRVDQPSTDEINLYIVSPSEPDLSHIVEQAGWQTGTMWQTRDYNPVLAAVRHGRRFAFRLRANPVHSISSDTSNETKPVAHVSVSKQEEWLLERGARNGFEIVKAADGGRSLRTVERGVMRFGKGDGRRRVTIAYATFEGILEVTDPELLRHALRSGIGRAKAYGCGLMTLAPAEDGP